jgi:hypothetical protein
MYKLVLMGVKVAVNQHIIIHGDNLSPQLLNFALGYAIMKGWNGMEHISS